MKRNNSGSSNTVIGLTARNILMSYTIRNLSTAKLPCLHIMEINYKFIGNNHNKNNKIYKMCFTYFQDIIVTLKIY